MAFQLNEKMIAHDRAIITRNAVENDLLRTDLIKFKPGMMHYVSQNKKIWVSTEPEKMPDNSTRAFLEIMTDIRIDGILKDYVNRSGGPNNSMNGQLHSTVANGTAPFIIASSSKVINLNADRVDDMHVDVNHAANTIVARDGSGNVRIKNLLTFDVSKIESDSTKVTIKDSGNNHKDLEAKKFITSAGEILSSGGKIEWRDNVWKVGTASSTSEIVTKRMYGHNNGIDSDTVDGKHVDDTKNTNAYLWTAKKIDDSKAPRGYGLGTDINAIPSNNCNSVTGTGFFSGVSPANGPAGENGEAILQSFISTRGGYQTIEYTISKNKYSRLKEGSSWSQWDKFITKENVLEDGVNVILSSSEPANITNQNTYWYEII